MPTGLNSARLYNQLLNTGLSNKDNPLYQVIYSLIGDLIALQKNASSSSSGGGGGTVINSQTINNILAGISLDGTSSDEDSKLIIPGNIGSIGPTGLQGIPGLDGNDSSDEIIFIPSTKEQILTSIIQQLLSFSDAEHEDRGPVLPSGFWVPAGTYEFIAGDSLGLNPIAGATTYRFGLQPGFDPGLLQSAFPNLVGCDSVLRSFTLGILIAGAKDTAANNAVAKLFLNGVAIASTGNITFQAVSQFVTVSGLSDAFLRNAGLELAFTTPITFTTNPTLCFFYGMAYTERFIPLLGTIV